MGSVSRIPGSVVSATQCVAFAGEIVCPRVRLAQFPPRHGVPRAGGRRPRAADHFAPPAARPPRAPPRPRAALYHFLHHLGLGIKPKKKRRDDRVLRLIPLLINLHRLLSIRNTGHSFCFGADTDFRGPVYFY